MDSKPKTWIAALLALFLGPFGFLYVSRPWYALLYLVAGVTVAVLDLIRPGGIYDALPRWSMLLWVLAVVSAMHCAEIAKYGKQSSTRMWYSRWWGLLSIAAGFFSVALVFRTFFFEPFRIPSASMYPTVQEGHIFVVKKFGYGYYNSYGITLMRRAATTRIARGDVFVFRLPQDLSISYVKRVIGLPGDHVTIRGEQIELNGEPVSTTCNAISSGARSCTEKLDGTSFEVIYGTEHPGRDFVTTVPEGHYFMLGDNRNNSQDSRYLGPVPSENMVGKLVYVFGQ